ncbi:hypothetical protein [Acaryochloris marina]|uniref:hypothetical protein n=1 Tax=Acaryochloris marina TaxID=155978 RepID=UPI0021C366F6|nr:hypothetical protein [Acaryochloris marina]BDM83079.1 hypothetical protein AM10699_59400 [Acaryochloris marina MBIC10699]
MSSIKTIPKSSWSVILLIPFIVGCHTDVPISPVSNPESNINSSIAGDSKTAVKFRQYNGLERFTLQSQPDGATLEDASGQKILRLKKDSTQKIKIEDPQEQVQGYVVPANNTWKLKSSDQRLDLFILRRQKNGGYQLNTGENQLLYRLKVHDYGYEVKTASNQSLYTIKTKRGKTLLKDSNDEILLYTMPPISPMVMASFGLDTLTEAQQTALAYVLGEDL